MSEQPIVSVKAVSKRFEIPGRWPWSPKSSVDAVKNVSLDLVPGEVLALVGQSGSGKTTLARLILGLEAPTQGNIEILGDPWSEMAESDRRPLRVKYQYIPQDALSALDPQQTAIEHVIESLVVLGGKTQKEAELEAVKMLEHLGLGERLQALPREMSGGEQRRVTLARVFALKPRLIVADEPTSGLDADRQVSVLKALIENLPSDAACVLVTHDIPQAKRWCNRALVMLDGEVVEEISIPNGKPTHPYAKLLFDPWGDHDLSLSKAL